MELPSAFATKAGANAREESAQLKDYVAQLERELSLLRQAISPFGLVCFDGHTLAFTTANETFCALVGYTEAELQRCRVADLIHPEDLAHLTAAGAQNPSSFRDTRLITKGGRIAWASVAVTLRSDASGRTIGAAVFQDITLHKAAIAQTEVASRLMKSALDKSAAGIWAWDATTNQSQWDARYSTMYGIPVGTPASFAVWLERLHSDDRDRVLSRIDEVRSNPGDDRWDVEFRAVRPDGEIVWMQGLGHAERNETGQVVRLSGINLDITERKHREELLRETDERLRAFVDRSTTAMAMLDREMRYRLVNRRWMEDFGVTTDIVGRSYYDAFPEAQERWREVHRRALAGESIKAEEERFDRTKGTGQWVRWEVFPWHSVDEEIGGIFILVEDITGRKRSEDSLRESEARHSFLLNFSDALRNVGDPSAILSLACQLLGEHLQANRVVYADIEGDEFVIRHGWAKDVAPFVARGVVAAYGKALVEVYRCAEAIVVNDVAADPGLTGAEQAIFRDFEIGAFISLMLTRSDRWVGALGVHNRTPRVWTSSERALLRSVAERILAAAERAHAERLLRDSEERLRLASEATGLGTFDLNTIRNESSLSPQLRKILELPETGPVTEEDVSTRIHPDDGAAWRNARARALDPEGPGCHELEFRVLRPDGTVRWLREVGRTLFEGDDKSRCAVRVVGTVIDVTDRVLLRRQLEAALRRTDLELAATVRAVPLGIMTCDRNGVVTSWNPAAERIFGYSASEALGRISPTRTDDYHGLMARILVGETLCFKTKRPTKSGGFVDLAVYAAPLHDEHGNVRGAVAIAEDITERTKAEAELARVRAALAGAREEEARRIARDLHDDVAQQLALLSIDIGRTEAESMPPDEKLAGALKAYQRRALEICDSLRRISRQMHPSLLDDLGLPSALEDLCIDFAEREGLPVPFRADVQAEVPREISSCMFRITQEALRNVAKHAKSGSVRVTLSQVDRIIELQIQDSGVGFNTASPGPGLGLHSMRERAAMVNGSFAVESRPGSGTTIVVRVPLGGTAQ